VVVHAAAAAAAPPFARRRAEPAAVGEVPARWEAEERKRGREAEDKAVVRRQGSETGETVSQSARVHKSDEPAEL
jgi:hypothetical protein